MRIATSLMLALTACAQHTEPPPAAEPARTVLEVYMHPDGKTNCVEEGSGEWRANPTCCPAGFSVAGFSAPAATLYLDEKGTANRRIFRHVICLEDG